MLVNEDEKLLIKRKKSLFERYIQLFRMCNILNITTSFFKVENVRTSNTFFAKV